MSRSPLIPPDELARELERDPSGLLVCDCSFDLAAPQAGRQAYLRGHVPGAAYVNLDEDLSGPRTGRNGRHPLPSIQAFAARMAALGAGNATHVVAYDASGGMYAARLWWMLRWAGHAEAAVLDGGIRAWRDAGLPLATGAEPARAAGDFAVRPSLAASLDYEGLRARMAAGGGVVIDARAADRFRGENETLDPVGGHIPGARNRPCQGNLAADGRFKPAAELRAEFEAVLAGAPAADSVAQCGSGVTACHNLLAMEAAGLTGATLYPGSWSEWSAQPGAPIATGAA